jgi:enamine deaminase RidA (YjgF/YER057c/UK114 family)
MELRYFDSGPRMSQGIVAGGLFFTAGQVETGVSGVAAQTRAILAKLDALLERAATSKSRVVSANVWLADIRTFGEMNAVWDAWIDPAAPPTRATVEAKLATPDCLVEFAMIAAITQ